MADETFRNASDTDKFMFRNVPSLRETDADVTALLRLMAEARKQGYRIGPEVTIGSVSVKIRDEKLSASMGLRGPEPEMSILSEHGFPMEDDE